MVSEAVSEIFGTEKSLRTGLQKKLAPKKVSEPVSKKNLVLKKVSQPVSEIFFTDKSLGIGPGNIWSQSRVFPVLSQDFPLDLYKQYHLLYPFLNYLTHNLLFAFLDGSKTDHKQI